jgi:hypothetical protein
MQLPSNRAARPGHVKAQSPIYATQSTVCWPTVWTGTHHASKLNKTRSVPYKIHTQNGMKSYAGSGERFKDSA